jgi:hypothetical protein
MKRAVRNRQILVWVVSLVVVFSMVCSAASFIFPDRKGATVTATPTIAAPTQTPTSQPSPEPVSTLATPSATP